MRVGIGWDSHRLATGQPLTLGGVRIPHTQGLVGVSDADVLLHAMIDAMLGAAALGDIGGHFPENDPALRGISSLILLKRTAELVAQAGFRVAQIDSILVAERPKLAAYIPAMRENIAVALGIVPQSVSVKAKTAEGLDSVGRGESMQAQAVVLLEEKQ